MYLTYAEYAIQGGEMRETDYNRFSFYAEQLINKRTFHRLESLKEVPQEVKMCVFELTERIRINNSRAGISSESQSNGSISESYSYNNREVDSTDKEYQSIIYTYLDGVRVDGKRVLSLAI